MSDFFTRHSKGGEPVRIGSNGPSPIEWAPVHSSHLEGPSSFYLHHKNLSQPRVRPAREIQQMAHLIEVTALELAEQEKKRASSLWNRTFSSQENSSRPWADYAAQVKRRRNQGPLKNSDIKKFFSQAPGLSGTPLQNLKNIWGQTHPRLYARALLRLGERYMQDTPHSILAHALLDSARHYPQTRAGAEKNLQIMSGGGSFFEQLQFRAPQFLRELSSPLFLFSFGTDVLAARTASLAVLSRASRLGFRTWALSQAAALSAEVPALVLSRRLGAYLLVGGDHLFSPQAIGQELLLSYGPFALLRTAGGAFQLGGPYLKGALAAKGNALPLSGFQRGSLGTLRLGLETGAVMAGHHLSAQLFPNLASPHGANLLYSSLLTVAHMRMAGHLVDRLLPHGLSQALQSQQARLTQRGVEDVLRQGGLHPRHPLRGRALAEINQAMVEGRLGTWRLDHWVRGSQRLDNARVSSAMARKGLNTLSLFYAQLPGPSGRGNPPLFSWGISNQFELGWQGAQVGRVTPPRSRLPFHISLMEGKGEGKGEPSTPGATDTNGQEAGSSSPGSTLRDLLIRRIRDYDQEAEQVDNAGWLDRAVHRVNKAWNRVMKNPDGAPVEGSIGQELQEAGSDLKNSEESSTRLQERLNGLRVLADQYAAQKKSRENSRGSAPSEEPVEPPPENPKGRKFLDWVGERYVALRDYLRSKSTEVPPTEAKSPEPPPPREKVDSLDVEEIRREIEILEEKERNVREMEQELNRAYRALLEAKNRGATPRNRERLNSLIIKLNKLFPGLQWRVPLEPVSAEGRARQVGSLLGLGVRPDWSSTDSPMAQALRGELESGEPAEDIQLELLHKSLLTGAYWRGSSQSLKRHLEDMGQRYQESSPSEATARSQVAMALAG